MSKGMDERRVAELAAVQAAVEELCSKHQEVDILRALGKHCQDLAIQLQAEGNRTAALYWDRLAFEIEDCCWRR